MSWFYLPSVDRLEDRCVPAVDLLVMQIEVVPPPESAPIEVVYDSFVEVVEDASPAEVGDVDIAPDAMIDYYTSIDIAPVVEEAPFDSAAMETSDPFVDYSYTSIDIALVVEEAPFDAAAMETSDPFADYYFTSIDIAGVIEETSIDMASLETSDPFIDYYYTSMDIAPVVEDAIDNAALDAGETVDPFFVIDPPLIDPSAPVQPTPEPSETDAAPVPFDLLPLLPPIAPPFWF